jgi:hypothetical protein
MKSKTVEDALARIEALEAKGDSTERKALIARREMSAKFAATLSKIPLAIVKEICASLPLKGQASAQSASDSEELAARMGVKTRQGTIRHEGKTSTFEALTREDARRACAKLAKH